MLRGLEAGGKSELLVIRYSLLEFEDPSFISSSTLVVNTAYC